MGRRRRRSSKSDKPKRIKGLGKHHLDLDGNVIPHWEELPVIKLCSRCLHECKQRGGVVLVLCPKFDKNPKFTDDE